MKDMTAGTSQSKNTKNFNHEELWAALRDATDLMERCVIPGFLLGETARSAWDNQSLACKEIEIGIKSQEYTDRVRDAIRQTRPSAIIEEDEARYLVGEVPVRIRVIRRKYEFLNNLDKKIYLYDQYLFPNPFEKYYKARYIVQ